MGLLDKVQLNTQTSTPSVTTAASTTTASTVTNPLPLVQDTKKDENKGLTVEKTTSTKSKRTINEAMRASYKDWDKLTTEDKEKKIIAHLTSVKKEDFNYLSTKTQPDGRVGWLKSFLLNDRMSKEESQTVVGALKQLNINKEDIAELQAAGVDMAFDKDNLNRESCQLQVAKDIDKYGTKAQKVAIDETSTSEFDSVKIESAQKTYKLKPELQDYAVEKGMEGAKTSSTETKIQIGHIYVDQNRYCAKEKQVRIHEIISTSDIAKENPEIIKYAAANIYHLDKTNQAAAVKITTNTGNEAAVKAAAEQYAKYDKSALEEIKETINSTNYDSAKEALAEAEKVVEAEAVKEAQETSTKEQTTSETTAKTATTDLSSKLKEIETSSSINKEAQMKELVKNATPVQLLTLLSQNPSIELIKAALEQNPTSDVLLQIINLTGNMADKDQKELVEKINNVYSTNSITSKMSLFSAKTQNIFVKESANKGNLKAINKMFLSASAKSTYDELMKKTVG